MNDIFQGMVPTNIFILGTIFGFVLCLYPLWALLDRAERAERQLRHNVCSCFVRAHHHKGGYDAA